MSQGKEPKPHGMEATAVEEGGRDHPRGVNQAKVPPEDVAVEEQVAKNDEVELLFSDEE